MTKLQLSEAAEPAHDVLLQVDDRSRCESGLPQVKVLQLSVRLAVLTENAVVQCRGIEDGLRNHFCTLVQVVLCQTQVLQPRVCDGLCQLRARVCGQPVSAQAQSAYRLRLEQVCDCIDARVRQLVAPEVQYELLVLYLL